MLAGGHRFDSDYLHHEIRLKRFAKAECFNLTLRLEKNSVRPEGKVRKGAEAERRKGLERQAWKGSGNLESRTESRKRSGVSTGTGTERGPGQGRRRRTNGRREAEEAGSETRPAP